MLTNKNTNVRLQLASFVHKSFIQRLKNDLSMPYRRTRHMLCARFCGCVGPLLRNFLVRCNLLHLKLVCIFQAGDRAEILGTEPHARSDIMEEGCAVTSDTEFSFLIASMICFNFTIAQNCAFMAFYDL